MRAGLAALAAIKERTHGDRDQKTSEVPLGRVLGVAPGLLTTDMARTVEHYRGLGFVFRVRSGSAPAAEAGFAIAERDGIELHFAVKRDHEPARTATWVYLAVEDADEIAAEFAAAGVEVAGHRTTPTTACGSWPTSTRTATFCFSAPALPAIDFNRRSSRGSDLGRLRRLSPGV